VTALPERPLPCGWLPGYLRDLVADESAEGPEAAARHADPADLAHLAGCPYCTAERDRLRARWRGVHEVASAGVAVPPELVPRTLTTLRALRGDRDGGYVELPQAGGVTRIREQVIVLLARELATELLAGRDGAAGSRPARVLAVTGDRTELGVQVALPYGEPVREVAEALGLRLAEGLAGMLGAAAPRVSVHVADLIN
jgi:uncharacterized alkaline shock family protein YloU